MGRLLVWFAAAGMNLVGSMLGFYLSWRTYELHGRIPEDGWGSTHFLLDLMRKGKVEDPGGYASKDLGVELLHQLETKDTVLINSIAVAALSVVLLVWSCYAIYKGVLLFWRHLRSWCSPKKRECGPTEE